jgi:hypothetical protein
MWRRRLDDSLVAGWIERASAAAPERSPERVRALAATATWHDDVAAGRAAVALADELSDMELRSAALGALQGALEWTGNFAEACEVAEIRSGLLPAVADPDHVADALRMTAELYTNVGRLAEAQEMVERLEQAVEGLTPHHRVHGLGTRATLEAATGDWETVRSLLDQVEKAVEANLTTPCPYNVGLYLLVAAGMAYGGDRAGAKRLEERAESVGMVGYGREHASRRLRLAVARHDTTEIRRIIDSLQPDWLAPAMFDLWAALFDGLAVLGDRDRIEADAPQWVRPDALVAPFAVRALAIARRDEALLREAEARFDAMGLGRQANRTRALDLNDVRL